MAKIIKKYKRPSLGKFALLAAGLPLLVLAASLTTTWQSQAAKQKVVQSIQLHPVFVSPSLTTKQDTFDALVYLQAPEKRQRVTAKTTKARAAERKGLVTSLRSDTSLIQGSVTKYIKSEIASRDVMVKRSFFVDNVLLVTMTKKGLEKLKKTPGVTAILPNEQIQLPPQNVTTATVGWNIAKIAADRVWNELGITGRGVTVANIDSGVQWDHPALKSAYRGWNGTAADHNYNWYDPSNTSPAVPLDNTGHGTHTMGTIVGFDGTTHIGVAPGATWVAVKGCANSLCDYDDLLAAGEWILAPTKLDGSQPDPSKAPNIVNNSWGGNGCQTFFQGVINTWVAAGIVPIFSAGNNGPGSQTVGSPGDNYQAISVGAVASSDIIADFSSRGPTCAAFGSEIQPDIVAPGVAINSSIPYDGYLALNGTSMAAPHAAGIAALLLQSKPYLTPYAISQILKQSALDLGTSGPDNTYGSGLINAYNAVMTDPATLPSPTPTRVPTPTKTPTPTPTPTPFIKLLQPNGGQQLTEGQTYPISWSTVPYFDNITLFLISTISGTTIRQGLLPSSTPYSWVVSKLGLTGTQFKIEIQGRRGAQTPKIDQSDAYFTIISLPTPTPTPSPTPLPTATPQPTPTPNPRVACVTNADCGCGIDASSNACAIENKVYLKNNHCNIPDFCSGITGRCGPACVNNVCRLSCP